MVCGAMLAKSARGPRDSRAPDRAAGASTPAAPRVVAPARSRLPAAVPRATPGACPRSRPRPRVLHRSDHCSVTSTPRSTRRTGTEISGVQRGTRAASRTPRPLPRSSICRVNSGRTQRHHRRDAKARQHDLVGQETERLDEAARRCRSPRAFRAAPPPPRPRRRVSMPPPGKLIWPAWLRRCPARAVSSSDGACGRSMIGTSTAAARGAFGMRRARRRGRVGHRLAGHLPVSRIVVGRRGQ